jgi:rubrerythrin
MSIDDDIARLRKDAAGARTRHARAEAELAQEEAKAAAAREDLRAEFGVSTTEEARALLAGLDAQIESEATEVRRKLAQAGGAQ